MLLFFLGVRDVMGSANEFCFDEWLILRIEIGLIGGKRVLFIAFGLSAIDFGRFGLGMGL